MKRINLLLLLVAGAGLLVPSINNTSVKYAETSVDTDVILDDALSLIELNVDANNVVNDFRLINYGNYGCRITWASSNEEVAKIEVVYKDSGAVSDIICRITRPENEDVSLTLTAKASYTANGVTTTKERDFTIKVLKQSDIEVEDLPLEFNEDFTSYLTGIDLSNYYKWQLVKGDQGNVTIVDSLPNFNDMIDGKKAIDIRSMRLTSEIGYRSKLNVTSDQLTSGTFVLEGSIMFTGETNGVELELMNGDSSFIGIKLDHTGFYYLTTAGYTKASSYIPKEGVWQRFRLEMRMSSYLRFYVYDWEADQYIEINTDNPSYIPGAGVACSSAASVVDGLQINLLTGSKEGHTYLSDIKLDSLENLALGKQANPNREDGIGTIANYEDEIIGFEEDASEIEVEPEFEVHNRFNEDEIYTENVDYTVSDKREETTSNGYKMIIHTYTITLTSTKETKDVVVTYYLDKKENAPAIVDFKVSHLQAIQTEDATLEPTQGYLTISGKLFRSDATIAYAVLDKDSPVPSAESVRNQTVAGAIVSGSSVNPSRDIEIQTQGLDLNKEYDVYAVAYNLYGTSPLYVSNDVSTVINISTPEELYDMTTNMETAGSTFRLINNIDCSSYDWNYNPERVIEFEGVLDGQGYSIENLNIESTSPETALFNEFSGTAKNLTFKNVSVTGLSDTAVFAGIITGGTMDNITFENCSVAYPDGANGGEGYFGTICGRFKGDSNKALVNNLSNINIIDTEIKGPKYIGLLTGGVGGSNRDVSLNLDNIYASGSVDTEGAAIGLIGRNRGKTEINNGIIFLHIINAKKEVGALAGHNKEGASLIANNIVSDLTIDMITQVTYFNDFIGSHDPNTSSYGGENVYYIAEDYTDLSDNIVPTTAAISYGQSLSRFDTRDQRWWESNTCFKDFDISTNWTYDTERNMPKVQLRNQEDIKFSAADYTKYTDMLSETGDMKNNYYPLMKANNVYNYLTEADKEAVKDAKTKYDRFLEMYNQFTSDIEDLENAFGGFVK